jgi:hypothetical protein
MRAAYAKENALKAFVHAFKGQREEGLIMRRNN